MSDQEKKWFEIVYIRENYAEKHTIHIKAATKTAAMMILLETYDDIATIEYCKRSCGR